MSSRHEKEKAVNVQVLLRCRPFSEDELRSNAPQVVTCNDFQREVSVSQSIAGKQFDRVFTFDKVFGPSAQQKDLYEQAVVPIVNEVLEGFNCTIFAYGQTGTGKTYTMEGECKRSKSGSRGELPVHAGVIPRAIKQIFDTLEGQNAEYSVKVTFLELYNEEITDLLAPEEISKIAMEEKQKKALPLMEDGKGGVLVRGLEEEIVTNAGEIFTLLERGSAKRRTAETLLNKQSSRSHSLFSITIHIKEATPEGEELIKCGKLNLVDLAGSENISRSGAREGRAREAGEINKSLLTLGRVITALVEHLGHIPYRDSKLTRLLRDSLGGRTKTCIIATVSPSVHCLEETLSTLDYAHRAKNIKNRPEVNQKMMKTTLIKDLYGEIDRLKAEVYATREKNGVYIPKDRYYQEESERKAMAEQIEQMSTQLETNQKQIEEMQHKHTNQIQIAAELTKKLEATEKCLEHTSDMLASTREELKQSHYRLKEKEFIISEQRKAENALTHQACVLRSDLEKSIHENALLFSKLAREDQLSATNRGIVDNFQSSMSEKITELCNTLAASISQQNQQIKQLEELCKSHLQYQEKSFIDLKDRVSNARFLYLSHLETQRNIVHLNNASTNGFLEEVSSLASGGCTSLDQLFASSKGVADQMLADILDKLSSHRSEIAHFAQELRERFNTGKEHTQGMSNFVNTLLEKMGGASADLHSHTAQVHEVQTKAILDFRKAYEEQTRVEAQNLIAEINNLISSHLSRQKELVEDKLKGFSEAVLENKAFLDAYTATTEGEKNDAKRKWEHMAAQAESNCVDGADFSSVKHCRMELLLQQCVNTADAASTHWKDMDQSVQDFSKKHLTDVKALVRNATETNEQYNLEIDSGWSAAEEDVSKNNTDVLVHMKDILEQDHASTSEITKVLDCQGRILDKLDEDHSALARSIRKHTTNTFQKDYKDYEPKGDTPVRSEPDVPSKAIIESLRAMPMEALTEEFRENHPYVSSKEPKPSMIPRSPLLPRN